jgi:hypothetical protein
MYSYIYLSIYLYIAPLLYNGRSELNNYDIFEIMGTIFYLYSGI